MIVHFIKDEKTIDQVINNFEQASFNNNRFIVFRESESKPKEYVHIKQVDRVEDFFIERDSLLLKLEDLSETDCVILHGLYFEFAKALSNIPISFKLAWVMMGFDIYSLPKIRPGIYGKESLKFLRLKSKYITFEWFLKKYSFLSDVFYKIRKKDNVYKIILHVQSKIDYCISYVQEDFDFLRRHYPYKYKFLDIAFYSLNQFVSDDFINKTVNGTNILIGNSNSVTSNHLDLFNLLPSSSEEVSQRKIYVPLSYGDDTSYQKEVIKRGQARFKENIIPLTDFISKDTYLEILESCSVGIFYHFRQQAMGNIIPMLWMGARIYLSIKNPLYAYFKRIGIAVYTMEEDFLVYGYSKLTIETIMTNKQALQRVFNSEKVKADFLKLVEILNK